MKTNKTRPTGKIGVILMAAGHSCRFGRNKLLADFGGRPLVCGAMEIMQKLRETEILEGPAALSSGEEETGMIGEEAGMIHEDSRALPGRRYPGALLTDPHVVTCYDEVRDISLQYGLPCTVYGGGAQSDTIRTALSLPEASSWSGCLFLTGDQPFLTADSVVRLLRVFADDPRRVCRLAWNDRPGNPVLFPSAYFDGLRGLRGDTGGSSLIRHEGLSVTFVQAGSERELYDADTEEDLQKLLTL